MSFSDTLETDVLNEVFSAVAYTAVLTIYVGLSTADPLDDVSGLAEPVGGAYARVAHINNTAYWRPAVSGAGTKQNSAEITFPEASGSWGTCTHVTLWEHPTTATLAVFMASGALGTSKAITTGDTPRFQTDSLTISLD
tara:strand:+ start:323 stop:739 length:417 start_codon:yes stop_codon:yes gene_type:complete